MILPSKHLSQDRALLTLGARLLQHLPEPKTVSALWEELPRRGKGASASAFALVLNYDEFVLALDLLFLIGVIEIEEGLIARRVS